MNLIKFNSPHGIISIAGQGGVITRVYLPNQEPDLPESPSIYLDKARSQLEEYFAGNRVIFDLRVSFENCTDFAARVYHEILSIKYGQTASYKDIAARIGAPGAYRAVGLANNKNNLPIIIPCHRIIGADGGLVGYAGGLEMKRRLLDLEKGAV